MKDYNLKIKCSPDVYLQAIDLAEQLGYKVTHFMKEGRNFNYLREYIIKKFDPEHYESNQNDKYNDCIGFTLHMEGNVSLAWYEKDLRRMTDANDWEASVNCYFAGIGPLSPDNYGNDGLIRSYKKSIKITSPEKLFKIIRKYKEDFDSNIPKIRQQLSDTLKKYPECKIGKQYEEKDSVFNTSWPNFVCFYTYCIVNSHWDIHTNNGTTDFSDVIFSDKYYYDIPELKQMEYVNDSWELCRKK